MSEDWFAEFNKPEEDTTQIQPETDTSSEDWFATPAVSPLAGRALELQTQIAKEQAAAKAGEWMPTVGDRPEDIKGTLGEQWKAGRLGTAASLTYGLRGALTDLQAKALEAMGAPQRVVDAAKEVASQAKSDREAAALIPGMVAKPPKSSGLSPIPTMEEFVRNAPGTIVPILGYSMPVIGPTVGSVLAGAPAFEQTYNAAVDRGQNAGKAAAVAFGNAVGQALLERLGGGEAAVLEKSAAKGVKAYFLELAKEGGLKRFLRRVNWSGITEMGENDIQTLVDLSARLATGEFEGKTVWDVANTFAKELYDATKMGYFMGAGAAGPVHAGRGLVEQAAIRQFQEEDRVPKVPSTSTVDALREVDAVRAEADRVNYTAREPAIDLMARLNAAQNESDRLERENRVRNGLVDTRTPFLEQGAGLRVPVAVNPAQGVSDVTRQSVATEGPVMTQTGGPPVTLTSGGVLDMTGGPVQFSTSLASEVPEQIPGTDTAIPEESGLITENAPQATIEQMRRMNSELADAQRGEPESAMLRVQKWVGDFWPKNVGRTISWALEHGGDLTHRMAQSPEFFRGGYEWVGEKVDKLLHALRNPVHVEKEVAAYNNLEPSKKAELGKLLRDYVESHRALPVFNEVQRIARDVAIALGELRFEDANKLLLQLHEQLKDPSNWEKRALEWGVRPGGAVQVQADTGVPGPRPKSFVALAPEQANPSLLAQTAMTTVPGQLVEQEAEARRGKEAGAMVGEDAGKAVAAGVDPAVSPLDGQADPQGSSRMVDGAVDHIDSTMESFANERELVAQTTEAAALSEAIFGDDPSKVKPEELAKRRSAVVDYVASLRARLMEAMRTIYGHATSASTVVQTREQAIEAIKALRQVALAEAVKLGDPKMFDRADADYRHMLDSLTSQEGPVQPVPNLTPSRTMADAISEYRDVVVAALPKVERQHGRKWEAKAKDGTLPTDPTTGGPITKELYVRQAMLGFQAEANKIFTEISQMTDDQQQMKEADSRLSRLLKEYKISPNSVGFRGNSALVLNSEMNSAIEDIRALLHGTSAANDPNVKPSLTLLSDQELAALAKTYVDNQAKVGALPNVGVLQFIQNELKRRAANVPPVDISPLSNTDEVNERIKARLGDELSPEAYKAIMGVATSPKERANMTIWDRLAEASPTFARITATIMGQGFSGLGVRPNWFAPHFGPSLTTLLAPLATFKQKVATAKLLASLKSATVTLRDSIMQDAARVGAVLDDGISAYIKEQSDQGNHVDKGLFYVLLGDAVTSGHLDQVPDQIRPLVQKEVLPFLAAFQKKVSEFATSPELKAKIFDSMNRYLYRDYAAFRDEDIFFKEVAKDRPEFTAEVDKLLERSSKKMFDDLYKAKAGELRNQGMTEEEIVKAVDMLVRPHAEALVEGMLRAHLQSPFGKPNSYQWLQKARLDYFKKRVLIDPSMRALLGEERHFGYAFQHTITLMANDISRYQFNQGLVDILRQVGILGDMREGIRTDPISKEKLVPVEGESVLSESGNYYYVTPTAAAVLGSWSVGADASFRAMNAVISYAKSAQILSPAGTIQNILSIPQTILSAVGFANNLTRIFYTTLVPKGDGTRTRMENILAWRAMKEFLTPGKSVKKFRTEATRGMSERDARMAAETGAWLDERLDSIGMTSRQFYQLVSELQKAGLDTGGEYAFELGEGAKPAFLDYNGRPQTNVFRRGINKAGEVYRAADVLSKVITYQEEIRQLRWKAGYDAETYRSVPIDGAEEGLRKMAAERALRLTQNPETTPDLIRNTSRGALGLAFFNFGGFFYQMARNYTWAHIYGAQDVISGQLLKGNADRMREAGDLQGAARADKLAERHLRLGMDRMVGAAASMGAFTTAVKGLLKFGYGLFSDGEDDEDRKQHIAYFRPYMSSRYEDFQPLRYWKGHDGRYYALIIPTGRTDIYDGMKQYVRVMTDPDLSPIDRVKAATALFRDQYATASSLAMGLVAMASKDDEADKAGVIFDQMLGQGPRFAYRLGKDVSELADEPYRHPSLPQPVGLEKKPLADIVYQVSRQLGIPFRVERVTDNLVTRYKQTWADNLSWLKDASDKYNRASPTERLKLIADNREKWDKMLTIFDTHRNHAFGTSHDSNMLLNLLSKETQIPKEIAYELVYGTASTTRPSLEAYLRSENNKFITKLTS